MTNPRSPRQEHDVVARLVRLTGESGALPEGAETRVRSKVHGAWKMSLRRRRRRTLAAAAAVVMAVSTVVFFQAGGWPPASQEAGPLATLKTSQGGGLIRLGIENDRGLDRFEVGHAFGAGPLRTGFGRAALELADGSSLRLDEETKVELLGPTRLRLDQGALYLDAISEQSFTIETPFGDVRDLGTQFEVRLGVEELQVRVREGRVDVYGPQGRERAEAGVELRLSPENVSRRSISRHGEAWRAYVGIAPSFEIEGATLAGYLKWLQRETGWQIEYRDPGIALSAKSILLHGSLEGLSVTESPLPVLQTCGLGGRIKEGKLEVFRPQDSDPLSSEPSRNPSTGGGA